MTTGETHDWSDQNLVNMCPACFNLDASDEKSVLLSLDGNMQHKRFMDRSAVEYEVLPVKYMVDIGRRDFDRTFDNPLEDGTINGCGNHFKATNGWNKTESATATKKRLDESGIMIVCCYHGICLRALNMHQSGERHSHGARLLDIIQLEAPLAERFLVCYDVACIFGPALHLHRPDLVDKVELKIGRFHIFGHEYACHIRFNVLRSEHFGLMVGEEPERVFSMLAPLVSTGRLSSGPRRNQRLDANIHFIAEHFRESFGRHMSLRYTKMLEVETAAKDKLADVLERRVAERIDKAGKTHPARKINITYLRGQASKQIEYYQSYR
jgi:hypothetical protein